MSCWYPRDPLEQIPAGTLIPNVQWDSCAICFTWRMCLTKCKTHFKFKLRISTSLWAFALGRSFLVIVYPMKSELYQHLEQDQVAKVTYPIGFWLDCNIFLYHVPILEKCRFSIGSAFPERCDNLCSTLNLLLATSFS